MSEWQKGIFSDVTPLKPDALYTARFLEAEEFIKDNKVRFKYAIIDENGEEQHVNRSFYISDKKGLAEWLNQHTSFDASDFSMKGIKKTKHLVQVKYFKRYPYIVSVLPVDGDIHV